MADRILTPPLPDYLGPHQPGITDPVWPAKAPTGFDQAKYGALYAGQLERQRHLHVITADVASRTREELAGLLWTLTGFARHQMAKVPPSDTQRPYDEPVVTRRVTVTVGFGATLFTTIAGDDRFNLAARRPASLKVMPQIDGDDGFRPRDHATDLVILVSSDDYYVNEYIFGRLYYGGVHPGIRVRSVERGYARPDSREPSGFEDGITNPRDASGPSSMHDFVYIRAEDGEPEWCIGGTYLAYRKIRRRMKHFFELPAQDQEAVFGVDKKTGVRLEPHQAHAHAAKINPRRPNHRDLFDMDDLERRFLRRPYFFDDGLDADGEELRGLHHLSFARNLGVQYEWPVLMWQTNPDFPVKGTGQDALYGPGGAANIGGGYYFMPAAANDADHLGTGLGLKREHGGIDDAVQV
ncbi:MULTISPECIES: Dyp-type peroxidase [unclassified Mesorhizobium]|uniref:Dyp-type peroxidase n=1 Tax=unclassified Mesorhizobium TaxID=325217 RepID=UPI0016754598|nr:MULTISPECIES: Dyp-type peroxidase [unclassified Mesorhizobium]